MACIGPADTVELAIRDAKLWKQDIEVQKTLVLSLAREADTIVIAEAINESRFGIMTNFKIDRLLKGSAAVGSIEAYQGFVSVPSSPCTLASTLFRNTLTLQGERYLLYVKDGTLLRAAPLHRASSEIPLIDELDLIKQASNPSPKHSHER